MNTPTSEPETQGAVACTDLLGELRAAEPIEFVRLVRIEQREGRYYNLLRAAGVRVDGNAGTSATRKLGNLCEALHGKARRNEYMAAFFSSSNNPS